MAAVAAVQWKRMLKALTTALMRVLRPRKHLELSHIAVLRSCDELSAMVRKFGYGSWQEAR